MSGTLSVVTKLASALTSALTMVMTATVEQGTWYIPTMSAGTRHRD